MYNTTNKMGAISGEGRHGFAYPSQFWYIDGMLIHAICNAGHITFRIFSLYRFSFCTDEGSKLFFPAYVNTALNQVDTTLAPPKQTFPFMPVIN